MIKKDDTLFNADEVINSLSNDKIKSSICDIIAEKIVSENTIYNTNETKTKAKNDYDSIIEDIRYFDIRDFQYWVWMHCLVCLFFIGEALILSWFNLYHRFIFATLLIVFGLLLFYLYVFLCKNKPIIMFRNSTTIIALIIFFLHYSVVFVDGGNKSIFLPGLLLLTTTILGLPRDNRNKRLNIYSIIISLLVIAVYLIPTKFFANIAANNILDQNQIAEEKENLLGIGISVWILFASICVTLILRKIGAKKIIK